MKRPVLALVLALSSVLSFAQDQPCDVHFSPATVKPKALENLRTLFASFIPDGESTRLANLRLTVMDLKKQKIDLVETLKIVSEANSLQDWQKARIAQIPQAQTQIVTLFRKMHSEYNKGGLFAGNKAFADLDIVIDAKKKTMNQICLLSYAKLPLSGDDKKALDGFISDLEYEVRTLADIDNELVAIIQKAQEQEHKKEG
jgi:hypothetical protein